MPKMLAGNMNGKQVYTDKGHMLGRVVDILVSLKSGKIDAILVRPEKQELAIDVERDEEGYLIIPYDAVLAVKEGVVISEEKLRET